MARKDTFFLRKTITTNSTSYSSGNIDLSAYTDVSRGKVLVVDRSFITVSTDGNGPIQPGDVVSSGTGGRTLGIQVCTESQTTLVQADDNSLFAMMNFYATVGTAGMITLINEQAAMNPGEFTAGFIVPTDKIHFGCLTGVAWTAELDVGLIVEVHTEKISLGRMQELLVSLTA